MGHTRIDIYSSKGVTLEGIVARPEGQDLLPPAAILCHPHPVLGGDLDHPVLSAIDWICMGEGIASLRFNFRGVGQSTGRFSNGDSELEDVHAAFRLIEGLRCADTNRMASVGYSFGASVLLKGIPKLKKSRSFVFIAPPLSSVRKSSIAKDSRPKLFICGQKDRVVSSTGLQRELDRIDQPIEFYEIPYADHGLSGHELTIGNRVAEFLLSNLQNNPDDSNLQQDAPGLGSIWPWR